MNPLISWIIISFLCSIGFAIWNLPRKYTLNVPQEIHNFYYWIGLFFTWIFFLTIFWYENIFNLEKILLWLFSGIIVVIGTVLFFIAIEKNWFALANSFKNIQAFWAYLWGWFLLWEFYSANPYLVFLGSSLIALVWTLLYTSSFSEFKKHSHTIWYAILTWIFYSFAVMLRIIIWDFWLVCLTQWISFIICFYWYNIYKNKTPCIYFDTKVSSLAFLSAFIVGVNILWLTYAYKYLEFSIAYAITNISTIWIILIWIFITKELNFKEYKFKLLLSIIIASLAIFLLYLSKIVV